jgi:hypothetical protein
MLDPAVAEGPGWWKVDVDCAGVGQVSALPGINRAYHYRFSNSVFSLASAIHFLWIEEESIIAIHNSIITSFLCDSVSGLFPLLNQCRFWQHSNQPRVDMAVEPIGQTMHI